MAVVSDKGHVCDTQVIRGLDKETDKRAVEAVRQSHLQPVRRGGKAVPVVITVEVSYWRKDGALVQFPTTPTVTQTQNESAH